MQPVVFVHTPFPADSLQGNSVSARRIVGILNEAGIAAEISSGAIFRDSVDRPSRGLIALHARRSESVVLEFRERYPDLPIALLLSGSDLYRDFTPEQLCVAPAVVAADVLVVAQEQSLTDLPPGLSSRSHCVPKSIDVEVPAWNPLPDLDSRPLRVLVNAHVRRQKNPLLLIDALEQLPVGEVEVIHVGDESGGSEEEGLHREFRQRIGHMPNYDWRGLVPRAAAVGLAAGCDLLVNTSRMEGGGNAVCEALHIGLPILASEISGNTGLVGTDHPGLFSADDPNQLAEFLKRARSDATWLAHLSAWSLERSQRFTREKETEAWVSLFGAITR